MMSEECGDAYRDHWQSVYDSCSDYFGRDVSELATRSMRIMRERGMKDILELGCGQGRDTYHFVKEGFCVSALDYSSMGISQLRECLEKDGVPCILTVHDMREPLPYPDSSFDVVYSHMLFTMDFNMDELGFMMSECLRVLRPGGLNIYSVRNHNDPHYGRFEPIREDTWRNPKGFIVHFLSEGKIRKLAQGYNLVEIDEFKEGAPPNEKVLYAVVMEKP